MRIVADATTTMKHLYRVAMRRTKSIKRADVSEMDEIVLPRIAERCPELAVIRNGLWGYRL
jgi:hypothetical protein